MHPDTPREDRHQRTAHLRQDFNESFRIESKCEVRVHRRAFCNRAIAVDDLDCPNPTALPGQSQVRCEMGPLRQPGIQQWFERTNRAR